jgi:hypothetical protein
VAGGFDPDPADLRPPGRFGPGHRDQQRRRARLGEGELERLDDHLAVMVGHQGHGRPFADIDWDHQASAGF